MKAGYYRIKLKSGDWIVAEWFNNGASSGWYITGHEDPVDDETFGDIAQEIKFFCRWKEYEGNFVETDCGKKFNTFENLTYCPHCGGVIKWE